MKIIITEEQFNNLINNEVFSIDYIISRFDATSDGDWYDVYPGYSKPIDDDEETMFISKENATKQAEYILDVFSSLPNPIPIYRTIKVANVNDVELEYPGESWSFSRESALEFGSHAGNNVLLSAFIDQTDVNWINTIDLFIIFSGNFESDDENEINIKDGSKIKDIQIFKYK